MNPKTRLADYEHPLVEEAAMRLTRSQTTTRGKLEKLFYYVRDDIEFAFPVDGDLVKASETIQSGLGQCNTKGTLFLALCKAIEIPARLHFSLIKKEIQRGFFTGVAYSMLPKFISHAWLEVEVDGSWRRIDSYINDETLYRGAKAELSRQGWATGFSVASGGGGSSAAFNIDDEAFVQMDAVTDDHGVWEEPGDYFASEFYKNRPGRLKLLFYRLFLTSINKRVSRLRRTVDLGSRREADFDESQDPSIATGSKV